MANCSDFSSCKCDKCGNEMYNKKNLKHHLLFCGITQANLCVNFVMMLFIHPLNCQHIYLHVVDLFVIIVIFHLFIQKLWIII